MITGAARDLTGRARATARRHVLAVVAAFMAGCLGAASALAQTTTPPRPGSPTTAPADPIVNGDYWLNFARIPYEMMTAPLRFTVRDWAIAGFVAVDVAALLFLDKGIKNLTQDHIRGETTDDAANVARQFGEVRTIAGLGAAGYIVGALANDRRLEATSLTALQSYAITAGLTEGIKRVSGRDRPNQSGDQFDFHGPSSASNRKSFVSGHASHAFSFATVVASEYRESYLVPPLAYGLATLAALSRINDNKHWMSDVVLGSALGFAVGKFSYNLSPFKDEFRNSNVAVLPMVDGDRVGLNVRVRF